MDGAAKTTRILFVCLGNMCRSPMAEGFARVWGGEAVESFSAGTMATGEVSEGSIGVMGEVGIDISNQTSNDLSAVPIDDIDIVVNMTRYPAVEFLPPSFHGRIIDWDVVDPLGSPRKTYRFVRDEIGSRVRALLKELGIDTRE